MMLSIEGLLPHIKALPLKKKLELIQAILDQVGEEANNEKEIPYPLTDPEYRKELEQLIQDIDVGKIRTVPIEETGFWKRAQERANQ